MNKIMITIGMLLISLPNIAAEVTFADGGQAVVQTHDQISEFVSMNRWYRYIQDREKLIQQGKLSFVESSEAHALYDFPLATTLNNLGYYGISNFVDQAPAFPGVLLDYNGGMRTYDTNNGYNHQGIDYFT